MSLVNIFPQAFLEVLHDSLQHGGRNCCHFVPDVMFQVHRCLLFLLYTLLLSYPQSKKSQTLRLGNLADPSTFPLHESRRAGNISHCSPCSVSCCPVLLKPESLDFNTKSLQLQFQKCVKHLSVGD